MKDIDFRKIDSVPVGAVRFFKIMMRFEYALKARGFAEMNRNSLEISWNRFANERLGKIFFERLRNDERAATLINQPPSHQFVDAAAVLSFKPAAQVQSAQDLLGALRRVRNNLFHGGKAGDIDHDRNDTLIAEATYVITQILQTDDLIRSEFEGNTSSSNLSKNGC